MDCNLTGIELVVVKYGECIVGTCIWNDSVSVSLRQRLDEYSPLVGLMEKLGLGVYDPWTTDGFDPYSDFYGSYYSFGNKGGAITWYDRVFVCRAGEWVELSLLSELTVKQFFLRHMFPTEMLEKENFDAVVIYHHERGYVGESPARHHVLRVWFARAEESVA